MLDINLIRTQPELVKQAVQSRQNADLVATVDAVLTQDARRRELLKEVETLKAERNKVSKEIGRMKDPAERQTKIDEQKGLGDKIAALDADVREVDEKLLALVSILPNVPDARTPVGESEAENVVLRTVGEPKACDFTPVPHWDLGPRLGIIDFERGVKLTGSRFYVLNGAGARLQRALIAWMLDLHTRLQGYTEVYTPFMVRADILFGAGQLPKFRDNLYHDAEEDLWMVPTAEVPMTGLHKDEILDAAALPRRYSAYTPCFRREKMAAGRDVRGIKRGHQFDKVEMYIYCRPEDSDLQLEKMREDAEQTCAQLGLAYRVKQLCTGDLGFGARMTYDLEVWAPGCGEWLEVSSVSNCGDFQARRANIKFRREAGAKPELVHTLNGSGLGLPRTLIAVLENNQQADGSVVVPEVLRPWMGGIEVIRAYMDILVIVITFIVMLAGVAGVVLPVLPDVWLIWLAALGYGFLQEPLFNSWLGGIAMGFLTLLAVTGQAVDWLGGHAGAAAKGGLAWQSVAASLVLGLAGLLVFPPFGPLVGALLGLFLMEFFRHQRNWRKALDTIQGYLAGVGLSVVVRLGICIAMIGVWGLWVGVTKVVIPWLALQ